MSFKFNFKTQSDKSSDSQTQNKTFNFKSQSDKSSDSQTQNKTFSFKKPEANSQSSPDTTTSKSQASSQFKFKFTSTKNSTTTEKETQPSKQSSFQFNLRSKELSFHFGTGKEFLAREKKFGDSMLIKLQSQDTKSRDTQSQAQQEDNVDKIEDGFIESEKTGEEDEENLLKAKARLYAYVKPDNKKENSEEKPGYRERGDGELHFNFNKEQNFYRLVMRRKQIGNIILNQRVFTGMNPQKTGKNGMIFLGQVNAMKVKQKDQDQDQDKDEQKIGVLLLKFADEETTNKLISLIQKAISEIKA